MSSEYDISVINKKLDALSISILASLTQILKERQYLEDNLKEGFINMAKSRYLMRGQDISMLQIDTSNLKSTLKSSSSLNMLEGVEYMSFMPVELCKSGVKDTEIYTTDSDKLCEGIKNVTISSHDFDGTKKEGLNLEATQVVYSDPLKWFGVLVPEVLKKSQMRFKQATVTALHIASLQNQLKNFCAEYRNLRLLKKQCTDKD